MAGAGLGAPIHIAADTEKTQAQIRGMARRLRSMEPAMAVIEEVLATAVADNFEAEGERGDKRKWYDLADETWDRRREGRGKGEGKILTDTGALNRSVQAGRRHDRTSAEIGTDLVYAATHQFGDPRRKILPRPFLFLTDEDQEEIVETIADFVDLGNRGLATHNKVT